MTDRLRPLGIHRLAEWIVRELETDGSVLGIPRPLFFVPHPDHRFRLEHRGRRLETPIGVAAGPHTQLAHNIVAAWLCGARLIELKTVQALDAIDVAKPCIDMQDAGYNTEWSQELAVDLSFAEYLGAWVLIHALHRRLGFPGDRPGVVFDLSVGYDLAGLRDPKMRRFLDRAADAGDALEETVDAVARWIPEVRDIPVPRRLADSVTLSTMHGCPPEEIGAIAELLLENRGLHTAVKLNPTLLGLDTVRELLVERLGWRDVEPQPSAFEHDLDFDDAVALLRRLQRRAADSRLGFGVKLCNTLPVVNRRPPLHDHGETSYLSGRPLHGLAVALADRLRRALGPDLAISFAGGADAFNTPDLLAAGLRPVTVCSDLLRPGGYLRLGQYLEQVDGALDRTGAPDLDGLVLAAGGRPTLTESATANLRRLAEGLRDDPELRATSYRRDDTKTARELGIFDCTTAPCTDACSIGQLAPAYLRAVAAGDLDEAARIIAADNPMPTILGRACHHPCEAVCTRTHLDRPVAIREVKRYVTDSTGIPAAAPSRRRTRPAVAIVGAGPCGLAAAVELARAGVTPTIYDAGARSGGMVSATIPRYRASRAAIERDLSSIEAIGIGVELGVHVGRDLTLGELFDRGVDEIVVACGAPRGVPLGLDDDDAEGVFDGLDLLRLARRGAAPPLGDRVAVIGGGDVAIDCARTARRLTAGRVTILYRRTEAEMPAHPAELADLRAEGIAVRELLAPWRIVAVNGRLAALECAVMRLGEPDESGRPRPEAVPGERVTIELDSAIVAIGQRADLSVFEGIEIETAASGFVAVDPATLETSVSGVFVGGDLRHPGPSNIVDACGDGRRIAGEILRRHDLGRVPTETAAVRPISRTELLRRRSRRLARVEIPRADPLIEGGFVEIIGTLDADSAAAEARRCLDCDLMCSTCETVCPNRAIVTYRLDPRDSDPAGVRARQTLQIAVLADLCNECGNCVTFCPTAGSPWRDKPRFHFHRGDFEAAVDNAFMLLEIDGRPAIQGRFGGATHQLVADGGLRYAGPADERRSRSDEPRAVLRTLFVGLTGSMPHLPRVEAKPEWVVKTA